MQRAMTQISRYTEAWMRGRQTDKHRMKGGIKLVVTGKGAGGVWRGRKVGGAGGGRSHWGANNL